VISGREMLSPSFSAFDPERTLSVVQCKVGSSPSA
jgi:hypothetical protein